MAPDAPAELAPADDPGWLLRVVKDQRVAFLLVGGFNTAVGFFAFVGFDRLYATRAPHWSIVLHNTLTLGCAHVLSVIVAFVLYRTLVFRVRGHLWRDAARFESVYLVSLGVNWALLNLLTVGAALDAIPAQAIVVTVIAVISFFGHKHFSFSRPATGSSDSPPPGSQAAGRTGPADTRGPRP